MNLSATQLSAIKNRGAGFTPSDINNLVLWADPNYNSNGQTLGYYTSLVDLSGSGNTLTQSTGSRQPIVSRNDNKGNLITYSADITQSSWSVVGATKDSSTTLTFTAMNGGLTQGITTLDGISYRFSFKARAISGNTSLVFVHINSATGGTTALNIDGTLTEYTVTVLGRSGGGSVTFGVGDTNASGFGQIEITELSVTESTWDTDYIATTTPVSYAGINGRRVAVFDGVGDNIASSGNVFSGSAFTVGIIVKPTGIDGSNEFIASQWSSSNNFIVRVDASGKFSFFWSDGTARSVLSTTSPSNNETYVLIACAAAGSQSLYVNGTQEGSASNVGAPILTGVAPFRLGSQVDGASNVFRGNTGTVVAYNKLLNSTEIDQLNTYLTSLALS